MFGVEEVRWLEFTPLTGAPAERSNSPKGPTGGSFGAEGAERHLSAPEPPCVPSRRASGESIPVLGDAVRRVERTPPVKGRDTETGGEEKK